MKARTMNWVSSLLLYLLGTSLGAAQEIPNDVTRAVQVQSKSANQPALSKQPNTGGAAKQPKNLLDALPEGVEAPSDPLSRALERYRNIAEQGPTIAERWQANLAERLRL